MYTWMYLFYLFCITKDTNKTQQQITTDHPPFSFAASPRA